MAAVKRIQVLTNGRNDAETSEAAPPCVDHGPFCVGAVSTSIVPAKTAGPAHTLCIGVMLAGLEVVPTGTRIICVAMIEPLIVCCVIKARPSRRAALKVGYRNIRSEAQTLTA